MGNPLEIRWGILATGAIAETFVKDLLVDPITRNVTTIKHTVVAAASSSSKERAETFLRKCNCAEIAKAYGSYEELVADTNIDIVYIATPHSHHYQTAMLALDAGKNVLCEKAFTVNAAQARRLVKKAQEKNLFLMEAVWTRYFPICVEVRKFIQEVKIGPVMRVMADLSVYLDPENTFVDGKHRMVNPHLAGGALLDLGVYSLNWAFQTLYQIQTTETSEPPKVLSALRMYGATGSADETVSAVLVFPRAQSAEGDAHAIATASMRVATPQIDTDTIPCVRIQGMPRRPKTAPGPPSRARMLLTIQYADGGVQLLQHYWPPWSHPLKGVSGLQRR